MSEIPPDLAAFQRRWHDCYSELAFTLYANRHVVSEHTSLKKFMGLKRFPPPADPGSWEPHKWEIGYRDYPLAGFRELVERHYRVLRTEFTGGCRSVFLVCKNRTTA